MRMRTVGRVALCCLAMALATASWAADPAPGKIGPKAVWNIPSTFLAQAHKACDTTQGADFAKCFIAQMQTAGASADSVSFTQELYKQNKGEVGILTGFHPAGPVDIAWVTYPLRANTNYGLLLVNGRPLMVNAEDLKLLDHKGLEQSAQFQDLKEQLPKVDVWPGDRDGKTWPEHMKSPEGELQFTIGYPLINGCHACQHEGFALFNWNFDAQGKFLGTSFIGMTPAPVQ